MDHDDFAGEPVKGLPEQLPEGEGILWQGRPSSWRLAQEALWLRSVALYFVLLIGWRFVTSLSQVGVGEAVLHCVPFVGAMILCLGIIYLVAYVLSQTTLYTITNRRVALRVGVVVTLNLNIPHRMVANALLSPSSQGHGTLALEIKGNTRVSYLMIWPHVRPWYMSKAQPALRCIPNAQEVAQIFADAANARVNEPIVSRRNVDDSAIAAQ